jgi:hypothetical protein
VNLDSILGGGFVAAVGGVIGLFFKYRDKWRIAKADDEETTIDRLKKENARAAKRADEAERRRDADVDRLRAERDLMADGRAAYRGILIEKGFGKLADEALEGLKKQRLIDQATPKTIRTRRTDDDG